MTWKSYHTKSLTETYLFKFLPKDYFIDFVKTGSIWFSRADKFGDKMECVAIKDLEEERPNYSLIEERKKKFLISCWHLAEKESLAFWDTYTDDASNRKNIALRFKRDELISKINDHSHSNDRFYFKSKFIHGKVKYMDLVNANLDQLNASRVKYPAFRKEKAFTYENEYRFVIWLKDNYTLDGYRYSIGNTRDLHFDIVLNPLLKKEAFSELNNEIKNMGFEKYIKPSVLTKWLRPEEW